MTSPVENEVSYSPSTSYNATAYTTSIPKKIVEILGLQKGDRIVWIIKKTGEVEIKRGVVTQVDAGTKEATIEGSKSTL